MEAVEQSVWATLVAKTKWSDSLVGWLSKGQGKRSDRFIQVGRPGVASDAQLRQVAASPIRGGVGHAG